MAHISVLLKETIGSLSLQKGMTVLDATFGGGGHSLDAAREVGKEGRLIALDADKSVFAEEKTQELERLTNFTPVVSNFRHAGEILKDLGIEEIDAAIFDLGLSSDQLESGGRGFSFQRDEPLAMTFKKEPEEGDVTAEFIVNRWSEETIATILKGFGEERFARSIAKGIIEARKTGTITRTSQLVEVIHDHTPRWYHHGRTHFATRTFQALRMAANDELGAIREGVNATIASLRAGGRIGVISFHSIEDREVKYLLREAAAEGIVRSMSKKPIVPNDEELSKNPRARSAKLRVAERI